ncbi:dihydrolipoyl dehydrogenase [Propioniciclava soli]|uniref:Dihydrolipoyl dehydrogenase n=1 Tax=Propioniciclava soli TaxID=2775081 RepID=A0ABZ3C9F4_9ACTN
MSGVGHYDVIVMGGGPGGYIAGERLAHAGLKVLVAEAQALGGTCLNVGCIPTKSLLNGAKLYAHALYGEKFGVTATGVSYDWGAMQAWKTTTVDTLVGGVGAMLKRLKCEVVTGHATLIGPGEVEVDGTRHTSEHVIIATGSEPVMPAFPGTQGNPKVIDSTGMLAVEQVPQRLAVIGGGVIGVEFASLFAALGSQVTVIEMMDEICPFMDADVAAALRKGIEGDVTFHLGSTVTAVDDATVVFTARNGEEQRVEADLVLMAVGRRPLVSGWGAEEAGLDVSRFGVVVDDQMRTNLPNVWAVGDVTGRSLLAHAAYRMGEIASAHIIDTAAATKAGQVMRWHTIPWAVYSLPEAAGVGLTQAQASERYGEILTATVPLALSGRFVAENGVKAPGLVKVVADAATRTVRGVHMLGTYAPETIWGAVAALETELSIDDLRQVVFPHPTVSEGIREAVWAVRG